MVGSGLKKLAKQYEMTVCSGVAYGSLMGYATTLSEGAGYKRIDISTNFPESGSLEQLQAELHSTNLTKLYYVQNLSFGPKWISVAFQDTIGTMKKIQSFIDWFYPLLQQCGAAGANVCLECGTEITAGGWYLINGVAYHLHDGCADHIESAMREQKQLDKEQDTGSYASGLLGAFLGSILGSAVWAIVLYLGYVASLVGLLIGWLAEKGYTLFRGKQGKGKVAILVIAIIFGVVLGTLIPDAVTLAQLIDSGELIGYTYMDIPAMIVFLMATDSEYVSATAGNVLMGLLFAAVGVFALLRKTNKEVTGATIKKLN